MLRFGFLPSDFNPMVLMLGEAEDLRALAAALRDFARQPTEMQLNPLAFCAAANGTRIALVPSTDASGGLHRLPGPGHVFAWHLDPARAAAFADRIDGLADPACRAGSETLEEGDVVLKVSRGEYTEDFLRP
jgi:hypothetical protein